MRRHQDQTVPVRAEVRQARAEASERGMSGLALRVVWPIHDDAMYEAEAFVAAWFEWPDRVEEHQVTVTGTPRMRVVLLSPEQQVHLRASRAVVCEAPVIRRTTPERTAA
jgi:hypothetical protein